MNRIGHEVGGPAGAQYFQVGHVVSISDIPGVSALPFDYNIVVSYGQSLSKAYQAFPSLTVDNEFGNLMLGHSVRPTTEDLSFFRQYGATPAEDGGTPTLEPLVGTNEYAGELRDRTYTASVSVNTGVLGEAVNYAAANMMKSAHNDRVGYDDSVRKIVTIACGHSGHPIENLMKVEPDGEVHRYGVYEDALQKIKTIADTEGKTCGVIAVIWMQGEANLYPATAGRDTTEAGYKAQLVQLKADMQADAQAICGNTHQLHFFTYQTKQLDPANDSDGVDPGMPIQNAQWKFTVEDPNAHMIGSVYPVTDKGTHLSANGSRWFGCQSGKVANTVFAGNTWKPLQPKSISIIGRVITLVFDVPVPPLQWGIPYAKYAERNIANIDYGFRVTDGASKVDKNDISTIEITSADTVTITLSRDPVDQTYVWYASYEGYLVNSHAKGDGCLMDSDAIVAPYNYEYIEGIGLDPAANIPELVNQPYPLQNWCVAFHLPVPWSS